MGTKTFPIKLVLFSIVYCEKRIPKHGDENPIMIPLKMRRQLSVKKESPNMGTKTCNAVVNEPFLPTHSSEKRIPKHGDENPLYVCFLCSIFIYGEKRIPKHGDENSRNTA